MRLYATFLALSLSWLATACAPTAVGDGNAIGPAPAPEADARPVAGVVPDLSCKVADDCAVKDVGNCCGYFPACVNKDSKVDPEAVRAECARSGMSSVCGFEDIQACECTQGQCRAVSRNALEVDR